MTPSNEDRNRRSPLARALTYVLRRPRLSRAPIALYRARLGFLLGPRMMLLEHTGRRSGRARWATLEILERPSRDRLVVTSGFGDRAQWYRNLLAHPECYVSTGLIDRRPARAYELTPAEGAAVLERYRLSHPLSYRAFAGAIEELNEEGLKSVPVLEFELRRQV